MMCNIEAINQADWNEITSLLPGEWTEWADGTHQIRLVRKDGLRLKVYQAWNTSKVMVEVALDMGGAEWEHKYDYEVIPSISVTPTRSSEALAKDIARRLIGRAEDFRRTIIKRETARKKYLSGVQRVRELLMATGAVAPGVGDKLRIDLSKKYGDVDCTTDRVYFNNLSMSVEDAIEVLNLLTTLANK